MRDGVATARRQMGGVAGNRCVGEPPTFHFQAAFRLASKGGATLGCRGLPLLVVGGETPALAKDKACFEAA